MEQYDINFQKVIGKGQFGTVYEAKHKQAQEKNLCAKVIIQYYFKYSMQFELDIMHYLIYQKHTNIVRILDIYQIVENTHQKTIIIMEYCKDGNLQEYLERNYQKLNLNKVLEIIQQLINALKFLHQNLIVHRDLKPANILLENGTIKITDFSTTRFIGDPDMILRSNKGTTAYESPQILASQEYTSKCDLYSVMNQLNQLGIIIHQLLFNKFPFGDKLQFSEVQKFHNKIKNTPYECPEILMEGDHQVKQDLRQLLNRMLRYEKSDRINWQEILNFQFKTECIAISSFNNDQDKGILSISEHQDVNETNDFYKLVEEMFLHNKLEFLNSNQQRNAKQDCQKVNSLSSPSARIRLVMTNNFDDVFIRKQTGKGLMINPTLQLQNFTKSEKIAHVIKLFMAKSKLTQEVISIQ